MGTNFYAVLKVTEEEKKSLQDCLNQYCNSNKLKDFELLQDKVNNINIKIHLGKRSAGWQFLWAPNWEYYEDTLDSITKFLQSDKVLEIADEYGQSFTFKEFIDNEVGDSLYNDEKHTNLKQYWSEFEYDIKPYSAEIYEYTTADGLRFSRDNDFD